MQLKLGIAIMLLSTSAMAQTTPFKVLDETEVNFLFNYYEQEGNHSPVTGGIGTEQLDCFEQLIAIIVPFDTFNVIGVNIGIDYYSSASCDRIDRFITSASSRFLSSASSQDTRAHADVSYTRLNPLKHRSMGFMTGFSHEFDVNSIAFGLNYSKASKSENTEISAKSTVYYDVWKLIYPGEIRNGDEYRYGNEEEDYDLDHRITSSFSFSWAQVVNKKLQFLIATELVIQNGILNTPFHRVYFDDGFTVVDPDTNSWLIAKTMMPENLPRSRFKIPIGIRINYYITDRIISRLYYRYYYDDFGVMAHTFSIELPVKVTRWLTVYPLYRYYEQTASTYFAPFGVHKVDPMTFKPMDEFYTSDYDLSGFTNQKFGGGVRISPVYGLAKMKLYGDKKLVFKTIEFKYARYHRSDGLVAGSFSLDLGFVF